MDSDIPDRNDVAFFHFDYYELLHAIALLHGIVVGFAHSTRGVGKQHFKVRLPGRTRLLPFEAEDFSSFAFISATTQPA